MYWFKCFGYMLLHFCSIIDSVCFVICNLLYYIGISFVEIITLLRLNLTGCFWLCSV